DVPVRVDALHQRFAERCARLLRFLLQPLARGFLAGDGVPWSKSRLMQQLVNVHHLRRRIARCLRVNQCDKAIVPHAGPSLRCEPTPAHPARAYYMRLWLRTHDGEAVSD